MSESPAWLDLVQAKDRILELENTLGRRIKHTAELQERVEELSSTLAMAKGWERREFIRRTATAYFASLPYCTDPVLLGEVWRDAAALWDAKPEDC